MANLPKPWKAEYAKSGRSSCKSCKNSINKDQLRLGKTDSATQFDGFMPDDNPAAQAVSSWEEKILDQEEPGVSIVRVLGLVAMAQMVASRVPLFSLLLISLFQISLIQQQTFTSPPASSPALLMSNRVLSRQQSKRRGWETPKPMASNPGFGSESASEDGGTADLRSPLLRLGGCDEEEEEERMGISELLRCHASSFDGGGVGVDLPRKVQGRPHPVCFLHRIHNR